jgi:hypothetical protein
MFFASIFERALQKPEMARGVDAALLPIADIAILAAQCPDSAALKIADQ